MTKTSRWDMADSRYGRMPVVCVDAHARCWAAWVACEPSGESIVVSFFENDMWSEPKACAPRAAAITGLAAAAYGDGIVVAWTEDGQMGGLKIAEVTPYSKGAPRRIVSGRQVPTHPFAASDRERLCLTWTVRDGAFRRVEAALMNTVDAELDVRHISEKGQRAAFPKAVMKRDVIYVVWQEMSVAASAVLFCRWNGRGEAVAPEVLIKERECTAAVPHLAASPSGVWAVWQTDKDVETGVELVRGIEALHIDDEGHRAYPVSGIPKIERRGKGEDQGFEFAVPMCAEDGRLIIVGRSSQSICRLELGAEGWSAPIQVDEPGWQCRGRPSAVYIAPGIWTACREKSGIVVRCIEMDPEPKGPPKLASEPILVSEPQKAPVDKPRSLIFGGRRILFGDIHQHTAFSDGTGTMEETYYRARTRYCDQVVAVTDHESFLGKRILEGEWRDACRVADEYYEPGAFVTLKGFEWTGKMHPGPGHKVVYLPPGGGPVLSRDDPRTDSSFALIHRCRSIGALAVPHHVGWTGADMEHHEPDVQTCWEIVSCHGAYERQGATDAVGTRGDDKEGQFIADALDRNLRFGLVGGSDGHGLSWHHGMSRRQDSHRTGLTGFLTHDITREGVLDALRKRRCYATSGAKIALWFEVDGRPMGEEVFAGSKVPFRVSAVGTEPIAKLCLVTNGGVEIPLEFNGITAEAHGTLPPPPDNGFTYYFVRLIQEDSETAWSSPIWLDPPATA